MKVAILLLAQNRHDLTQRVINQNFFNSGYNADCFLIDNGSDTHENFNYPFAGYDLSKEKRGIAAGVNANAITSVHIAGSKYKANPVQAAKQLVQLNGLKSNFHFL